MATLDKVLTSSLLQDSSEASSIGLEWFRYEKLLVRALLWRLLHSMLDRLLHWNFMALSIT